jgi:hypothetical protein
LKRVPLGTPAIAAANAPFAHIQVVSKELLPEPITDARSLPVVFKTPSYSQQTEKIMAAPSSYQTSSLTASLATNTTGTTFAAKARAAELNAVRSRKAAKEKEVETEDEVPPAGSVALGAIKFTKTRHRGKAWKNMGLDELLEESVHGDSTNSDSAQTPIPSNSPLPQGPEPHNSRIPGCQLVPGESTEMQTSRHPSALSEVSVERTMDANRVTQLEKLIGGLNISGTNGDQASSPRSSHEQFSQPAVQTMNPQLASRGSPVLTHGPHTTRMGEGGVKPRAMSEIFPTEFHPPIPPNGNRRQSLTATEENKLRNLGVLPPLRSADMKPQRSHDDPFIEQPSTIRPGLYPQYGRDQQSDRARCLSLPLARDSTGASNDEFRPPLFSQSPASHFPLPLGGKGIDDREDSTRVVTRPNQYQRDPKPYTSFVGNKKDFLLQNLHNVVESSKTQGSMLAATRTVLYDPAAREAGNLALDSPAGSTVRVGERDGTNPPASAADRETLKSSDPLPWTDRPVNIHDTSSPLAPPAHLPTMVKSSSSTQMVPPGLNHRTVDVWNAPPPTTVVDRSLEDSKLWFWKENAPKHDPPEDLNRATPVKSEPLGDKGMALEDSGRGESSKGASSASGILPQAQATARTVSCLMEAVYHNLAKYLDKSNNDHFGRYARVPEWCIDKSQGGDQSFFGDWGAWGPPPPRVGRDPRYRPTFHEGRYTVFEEIGRRGGRDGMVRRFH